MKPAFNDLDQMDRVKRARLRDAVGCVTDAIEGQFQCDHEMAVRLLAAALTANVVLNEIQHQCHFLVTGEP